MRSISSRISSRGVLVALLATLAWLPACDDDHGTFACANGECICGEDSTCDFICATPPCHVSCQPGAQCSGECANATCTCEHGATCDFACASGPCHVRCSGNNPHCSGECANGSCTCGLDSSCHFTCIDSNCSASCVSGAQCILECPNANAGKQGCTFTTCAAGKPQICPGGRATTCGTPCPSAN